MTDTPVIAIVDDDASVREGISSLVRSVGYEARTYASATDFLRADLDDEPSCVITDMQMPGMSGAELQRALRDAGRLMPVIVVTAFLSDGARTLALEAGAWEVFRKPCEGAALIRSLEQALDQRSNARQ